MIVQNIKPFKGEHCETTATGTLLNQLGIELSEPMLFGIGEGLGFIFWNMKTWSYPFLGGRIKPDLLSRNLAENLGLDLIVRETGSRRKAWEIVQAWLDEEKCVGLKLDCYHLEYFTQPFHFAAHYVALYGYDEAQAYLVDTRQQGSLAKTSLDSLANARAEKGPMSSKNLCYILEKGRQEIDLKKAILTAIRNNARAYLSPPITNLSYKGILKTSREIRKWFERSGNIPFEFEMTAMLMEKAGTGGALFRNLYRDFLKESHELLGLEALHKAHLLFVEIAEMWSLVSELFREVAKTKDIQYVNQASEILKDISSNEKSVMESLANLPA